MARHLLPPQRRQIEKLKDEGYSIVAIASKMSVDRHTVARHLESAGVGTAGRQGENLTPAEIDSLKALLAQQLGIHECANCDSDIWVLESMTSWVCPSCGRPWQRLSPTAKR